MSIKESGHHFIAIFGGAVAGAEAAYQLAKRGFRVVVFDQGMLPYGKIEDGLPKWHAKLRDKEEQNINNKINHENVRFVPGVRLGREVDFNDILTWGFTAVILATGAWKDRPLPVENIDEHIGHGFYYQNPFVYWFNHKHEPEYKGEDIEIKDDAIVVGGGLASLDVAKIIMFEMVEKALKNHGIETDLFTLDHGINKVLDKHNLTLDDLGLKGCTLYYRRRSMDMPLSPMPVHTPEQLKKAQTVRQKILENYQKKYLFKFVPCCIPVGKLTDNGQLTGIRFQRTKIEDDRVVPIENDFLEAESPLVISSIGSIPERIAGIPTDGSIFKITDSESCMIHGFDNVFAIGNAVTGKGNINESAQHSRKISEEIMEHYLEWHEEDYEHWRKETEVKVYRDIRRIIEIIQTRQFMSDEVIGEILDKTRRLQEDVGYDGNYDEWVKQNTPIRLENMI